MTAVWIQEYLATLLRYDGSLEALEDEKSDDYDGKNTTQRKCIKNIDQGFCVNYGVYLKPDSPNEIIFQHRLADYIMTGVITEVRNQKTECTTRYVGIQQNAISL